MLRNFNCYSQPMSFIIKGNDVQAETDENSEVGSEAMFQLTFIDNMK